MQQTLDSLKKTVAALSVLNSPKLERTASTVWESRNDDDYIRFSASVVLLLSSKGHFFPSLSRRRLSTTLLRFLPVKFQKNRSCETPKILREKHKQQNRAKRRPVQSEMTDKNSYFHSDKSVSLLHSNKSTSFFQYLSRYLGFLYYPCNFNDNKKVSTLKK